MHIDCFENPNMLIPKHSLSITKWIHLHNGDEGMKEFFHKAYKSLKPGGIFVVEPQEYETYARRRRESEVCVLPVTAFPTCYRLTLQPFS